MRRALAILILLPLLLGQQYNVPFNPPAAGGFTGVAPIYDYDDAITAGMSNITFWANFQNCSPGTTCPQNGTEYALAATTEYSIDVDGCSAASSADVNSPDIVDFDGTPVALIKGSTRGIHVDGGSGRTEAVVCDNSGGTLTQEVNNAATQTISGCIFVVAKTDSVASFSDIVTIVGPKLAIKHESTTTKFQAIFTSTSPQTITGTSTADTNPHTLQFSYLLRPTGDGNDQIRLYVDGVEEASYTAGDLGTWDLAGGSDLWMGTSSATIDHMIDLVVVRSCAATGCSCDVDSLYDDIVGTCDNSATRCLVDADCGGGTCAP